MLATHNEPLKLADGTLVFPNGEIVDPSVNSALVEVPSNREAVKIVVDARKRISDLPDVPRNMNIISVILAYTLFGLSDEETAIAVTLPADQVGRIKMLPAYEAMHTAIVEQVSKAETDDIRNLIQRNTRRSLQVLSSVLEGSKSEANKIVVARDLLDRGGFRPADVVEHRVSMGNALTINVVRKTDQVLPTLDMTLDNAHDD